MIIMKMLLSCGKDKKCEQYNFKHSANETRGFKTIWPPLLIENRIKILIRFYYLYIIYEQKLLGSTEKIFYTKGEVTRI